MIEGVDLKTVTEQLAVRSYRDQLVSRAHMEIYFSGYFEHPNALLGALVLFLNSRFWFLELFSVPAQIGPNPLN